MTVDRLASDDRKWVGAALLVVAAVALALRLAGLHYALWNDEVASIEFASAPLHLLWSDWMVRETNPPLYYTLLREWSAVFGGSDTAVRLMSVVIGSGGVALVFALGRRADSAWTGVLAAALVAVSAQNILYSQQVRGYILAFASATLAIWATLAFLDALAGERQRRWRALAGYLLGAGVAVYSHTTLIFLPVLTSVYVLGWLVVRRTPAWRPAIEWIVASTLLLLIWMWWARLTLLQAQTRLTIGWITPPSFPYAVRMTLESYVPWQIGPAQYVVVALAVGAAGWGAWQWRRRPERLLLPFLAVSLPAFLFVLSRQVPVFLPRTVYWGSAPFLVTVAAGIVSLRPRVLIAGAALTGVIASLAGWAMWFQDREIEPWRAIVAAIERQRPGATVVVRGEGPALALRRYCAAPRCTLTIVALASPATDSWVSGFRVPDVIDAQAAPALLRRRGSLVAVRWMGQDPTAALPADAQSYPLAMPPVRDGNIAVRLWLTPAATPVAAR